MLGGKHEVVNAQRPQRREAPRCVIGNAVKVMKIAVGEEPEGTPPDSGKDKAAQELGRKGGKARSRSLNSEQRQAVARKAAAARWKA